MKKAVVVGATGLVGGHLVNELVNSGLYEKIHILTRRKTKFNIYPEVTEHMVDFDNLEAESALFHGVDDVFVTTGTTMKKAKSKKVFMKVDYTYPLRIAKLAKEAGATRFLIVSAIGSNPEAAFFYSSVKGKLENALVLLDLPSLHMFRPSLLTGKREDFRLGERAAEWFSKPLSLLFIGPYEKYKPVQGKYVAIAMYAVAQQKSSGAHIYESDKIRKLGKVLSDKNE